MAGYFVGSRDSENNLEKVLTADSIIVKFAVPSNGEGKALSQLNPIQFDSSQKKRCLKGDGWVSEKKESNEKKFLTG